jgi:hypothetical protein
VLIGSLLFLSFGIYIVLLERGKASSIGPDLFSLFSVIFLVQVVVPGVVIPLLLHVLAGNHEIGNPFLDRVYRDVDGFVVALSCFLSILFYVVAKHSFYAMAGFPLFRRGALKIEITVVPWRLYFLVLLGLVSSYSLLSMLSSDGLETGYQNLVLFRAQDASLDAGGFVIANLFTLTQAFAFLSVCVFFVWYEKRFCGAVGLIVSILVIVFLGLMTASRRGVGIQLFLVYFAFVLVNRRWYVTPLALAGLVFFPVLMFGKEFLAMMAIGRDFNEIIETVFGAHLLLAVLNGFSSLGITLNSSWATIMYMDLSPRFGVDHFVTLLRFLPGGFLGYDEDAFLLERIVRTSTEVFVGRDELDIPPGLIGQMFLDFSVFGPVVWGVIFGGALGFFWFLFRGALSGWSSVGFFVVFSFVATLPINSGSIDFNLSIDMVFLLIAIFIVFSVRFSGSPSNTLR